MGRDAALPLLICRNLVVLFMLFIVGCCLFHLQMVEARYGSPGNPSPGAPPSPQMYIRSRPTPPCCT